MLQNKFTNKVNILLVSFFLVVQKVLATSSQLIPDDSAGSASLDVDTTGDGNFDTSSSDTIAEAFNPTWLPTEDLSLVYKLIIDLITFIFGLIGTIAVFMVIYGGFKYVTGSLSGKEEGKQTIKNALLGIVIALISYFIVNVFLEGLTTITTP